jgi:hypothetical protein
MKDIHEQLVENVDTQEKYRNIMIGGLVTALEDRAMSVETVTRGDNLKSYKSTDLVRLCCDTKEFCSSHLPCLA